MASNVDALDTGVGLASLSVSASASDAADTGTAAISTGQLDRTPPGQSVAASAASVAAAATATASSGASAAATDADGDGAGMTNAQLGIYAGVSESLASLNRSGFLLICSILRRRAVG